MDEREKRQQDSYVTGATPAMQRAFKKLNAILRDPETTEEERDLAMREFQRETAAFGDVTDSYSRAHDRLELDSAYRELRVDGRREPLTPSQWKMFDALYEAQGWVKGAFLEKKLRINPYSVWQHMKPAVRDTIESSTEGYRIKPQFLPQ